jgi:hypothetical protein
MKIDNKKVCQQQQESTSTTPTLVQRLPRVSDNPDDIKHANHPSKPPFSAHITALPKDHFSASSLMSFAPVDSRPKKQPGYIYFPTFPLPALTDFLPPSLAYPALPFTLKPKLHLHSFLPVPRYLSSYINSTKPPLPKSPSNRVRYPT